jgi:hypothetical protein
MVGENRTLEQRIRGIEDRLEIYNLIAGIRRLPIPGPITMPKPFTPRMACSIAARICRGRPATRRSRRA